MPSMRMPIAAIQLPATRTPMRSHSARVERASVVARTRAAAQERMRAPPGTTRWAAGWGVSALPFSQPWLSPTAPPARRPRAGAAARRRPPTRRAARTTPCSGEAPRAAPARRCQTSRPAAGRAARPAAASAPRARPAGRQAGRARGRQGVLQRRRRVEHAAIEVAEPVARAVRGRRASPRIRGDQDDGRQPGQAIGQGGICAAARAGPVSGLGQAPRRK